MSEALDDLTLLSIGSLVAVRLVATLLRGTPRDSLPFLGLLAAALAALAAARTWQNATLAFVGECVGLLLALAPRVLDDLERHRVDRFALYVAKARELLVPGAASTRRRRVLEQRLAVQRGNAHSTVATLQTELRTAQDPNEVLRLRTELVLVQLAAGEVDAALELAEKHFDQAAYARSPELMSALACTLALRGRLGPALQLVALLEAQLAANPGSPDGLRLVTRARLYFVAATGDRGHIEDLLAQRQIPKLVPSDEHDAIRMLSRNAPPAPDEMRAVAAQVGRRMLVTHERAAAPLHRRTPVTIVLIAANLLASAAVLAFGLNSDTDGMGLARAGALYGPAVAAGEPWRLVSVAFLHAGLFHLVTNMYALFVLGRVVEESLGTPRFAVIYAVSAVGGALASLYANRGLSVGASGAIMGLLGALIVTVYSRRHTLHPTARRMLLGNLVFLGLLQAFLGWQVPLIDSAAHGGGFVAGLLATAGLHAGAELGVRGRRIAIAAGWLYALVCAVTLVLVVRRPLDQTLLHLPLAPFTLDGVRVDAPASWQIQGHTLGDPYLGIELTLEAKPGTLQLASPQANDPRVRPLLQRISATATKVSQ